MAAGQSLSRYHRGRFASPPLLWPLSFNRQQKSPTIRSAHCSAHCGAELRVRELFLWQAMLKAPIPEDLLRTPGDSNVKLSAFTSTPHSQANLDKAKRFPYRQAVGQILYLVTGTRPELATAHSKCASHQNDTLPEHVTAVKHLLGFISTYPSLCLHYKGGASLHIYGYVDSDHNNDLDSGLDRYGYVFYLAGAPVSWKSSKLTRHSEP